jgi:uncharacterized protein
MRIPIDKIGHDGLDVDEALGKAWLKEALGPEVPFEPARDGRLRVHLDRADDDVVLVSGRARVNLEAPCARCLAPVPIVLDTPIFVTMVPKGNESPPNADGEVAGDDLGVATYDNREIDLSAVVHDEVFLELPMIPLCRESCAGLCPSCGHDLNAGPCGCEQATDDRWQALKRIRLKDS